MAADRIKGITIEISGDTKKLTDSLKNVNKEVTNAQKALSDVNKLLKLNPGNADLLVQKQKYLTDAIDATKRKLQEEKNALEQLKSGPQTEETLRQQEALTREIAETEQKLKGLTEEYRRFGSVSAQQLAEAGQKVEKFGSGLKNVGDSMARVGQDMTTRVTLPIVGAATVAASKFAEVDKTMTLTNQTMDNTTEQASMLQKAMEDAAAQSIFGMNDAATATLNFARAGLTAEEAAAALAPAMNLAAGEGGNLDTVSQGLVATINGFGDSFDKTAYYADIFAGACNNSALDVDSLSQAMSIAAPIFRSSGYNIEDAALYMGVMADNGIEANEAATALKTGLARLAKPAKEGAEALDDLGIEIFNADGSMKDSLTVQKLLHDSFSKLSEQEQLAAASAIFGKNQMSKWLALINTAPEEVRALSNELEKSAGTTNDMAEAMMSGFGGGIERLKSSLDVLITSMGQLIAEYIQPIVDKVIEMIDTFREMDDEAKRHIIQLAAIAAAVGPLLLIIGKLMSSIGSIIVVTGKLMQLAPQITTFFTSLTGGASSAGGAMGALGGSIGSLAAPIAAIVAAIGVLVAAFVHLWDTNEQFRSDMTAIWNDIVSSVNDAFASITEAINSFGFDFENIVEVLTALWDTYTQFIGVEFKAVFEEIAAVVREVAGVFEGLGQIITGIMTGDASKAVSGFGTMFESVFTGLATIISTPFKIIFGFIDQLLQLFGTSLPDAVHSAGEAIQGVAASIGDFFGGLGEKLSSGFSTAGAAVGEALSGVAATIAEFFAGVGENIVNFFSPIAETVMNTVNAVYTEIRPLLEAFQYLFETIIMAIQVLWEQAWTQIQTTFTTIWTGIVAFFTPIIQSIQEVIVLAWTIIQQITIEAFTAVQEFIISVWNAIVAFVTPILVQIQTAVQNAWTQIQSITTTIMTAVQTTITNIWNNIKSAIQPILDGIVSTIKNKFNEAVNFIKGLASQASKWGADIVNGLARGIRGAIGAVTSAVTSVADAIRSRIHFSRPDVGPLREYEKWMPDMMAGLAQGIRDNIDLVQSALADMGGAMAGSMNVDYTPQLDRISGNLANMNAVAAAGTVGDLYIPVYIGSELIDEIVVEAGQRNSYRSGGR